MAQSTPIKEPPAGGVGSSLIKGFFGMSRAVWEGLFRSSDADCVSEMLKPLCVGCHVCVVWFLFDVRRQLYSRWYF